MVCSRLPRSAILTLFPRISIQFEEIYARSVASRPVWVNLLPGRLLLVSCPCTKPDATTVNKVCASGAKSMAHAYVPKHSESAWSVSLLWSAPYLFRLYPTCLKLNLFSSFLSPRQNPVFGIFTTTDSLWDTYNNQAMETCGKVCSWKARHHPCVSGRAIDA